MQSNPPITPGLTEGADGSEDMQLLATLAMMRSKNRKKFDALFDSLSKLFTPKEPEPEPSVISAQPSQSGQALGSLIGQPSSGIPGL